MQNSMNEMVLTVSSPTKVRQVRARQLKTQTRVTASINKSPKGNRKKLMMQADSPTQPDRTPATDFTQTIRDRFAELFAALPALGSADYYAYLQTASLAALPAQVLARAYRELLAQGAQAAADATLERLLDQQQKFGYLTAVRNLARKRVPDGQQWHDEDDLYQTALLEIIKVLATPRGSLAETAWVRFCQNCFTDAWRSMHGRRGERLQVDYVEPMRDDESGEYVFHVEQTTGEAAPWHAGVAASELPRVEALIQLTIREMADPLMQAVARDQFSANPSPISGDNRQRSRPPLTEQLQASRFQISRALRNAKARLAAALLQDAQLKVDRAWLREFVK